MCKWKSSRVEKHELKKSHGVQGVNDSSVSDPDSLREDDPPQSLLVGLQGEEALPWPIM